LLSDTGEILAIRRVTGESPVSRYGFLEMGRAEQGAAFLDWSGALISFFPKSASVFLAGSYLIQVTALENTLRFWTLGGDFLGSYSSGTPILGIGINALAEAVRVSVTYLDGTIELFVVEPDRAVKSGSFSLNPAVVSETYPVSDDSVIISSGEPVPMVSLFSDVDIGKASMVWESGDDVQDPGFNALIRIDDEYFARQSGTVLRSIHVQSGKTSVLSNRVSGEADRIFFDPSGTIFSVQKYDEKTVLTVFGVAPGNPVEFGWNDAETILNGRETFIVIRAVGLQVLEYGFE